VQVPLSNVYVGTVVPLGGGGGRPGDKRGTQPPIRQFERFGTGVALNAYTFGKGTALDLEVINVGTNKKPSDLNREHLQAGYEISGGGMRRLQMGNKFVWLSSHEMDPPSVLSRHAREKAKRTAGAKSEDEDSQVDADFGTGTSVGAKPAKKARKLVEKLV
jgi:hypothetical protein